MVEPAYGLNVNPEAVGVEDEPLKVSVSPALKFIDAVGFSDDGNWLSVIDVPLAILVITGYCVGVNNWKKRDKVMLA